MSEDTINCSECDREVHIKRVCIIDERPVCFRCMYGEAEPLEIYPIGKVRTNLGPQEISRLAVDSEAISCIDLLASQKRFLHRLEDETSLLIIYYLHNVKSVFTVFHRRLDGKKVGVFASRTPNRLSKIAVQDVKLLRILGTKLYVEGLDAMEGSPVLDIKLGLGKKRSFR
jgi:tRNA (Thr-GGU) A37 N-methylase